MSSSVSVDVGTRVVVVVVAEGGGGSVVVVVVVAGGVVVVVGALTVTVGMVETAVVIGGPPRAHADQIIMVAIRTVFFTHTANTNWYRIQASHVLLKSLIDLAFLA
jgi:hypothetical protein